MLLAAPVVVHAADGRLRYDPFAPLTLVAESSPGRGVPEGVFEPVLRSTLLAGDDSMANLGGEILRVGETVEGYTLIAVGRFEATFQKDGVQIRIPLRSTVGQP
jgi:hypothetical protein